MGYQPNKIEKKWQKFWDENKTFRATMDKTKEKLYILDMFPYPSGSGLHVGHPEGYTATDIFSRYKRNRGFNVLHTMGWDAFGLPAEQYAIKTGQHPKKTTEENIANFKKQIKSLGFSYDWDREINTSEESYYRWTQWIFLQLFNKGLAYQDDAYVNWCPELKAVLANEEVKDGLSDIGGHPIVRKPLRQWMLKITDYAERLLEDLELLDWPKSIIEMQKNWIGKSSGAMVRFQLAHSDQTFEVYTTRPDTLFGATYCVFAPDHPLVFEITHPDNKERVQQYFDKTMSKSEQDRLQNTNEKSGEFTGAWAMNPVTNKEMPIYISDYVLLSYGTGAIMAVPAHDQRDHDFAKKFNLEIVEVVSGSEDIQSKAYSEQGKLINSDFLNGLDVDEAKSTMIDYLEREQIGEEQVNYKLRDWVFSRQRYWGEPIPILLDDDSNATALDENELPLTLPKIEDFQPDEGGVSPLNRAESWLKVNKDQKEFIRETNTMPQWAGSCWYYLRYIDPTNTKQAWSKEADDYWMPVDLYVGGAEHAVLHLLYARFWHKVLYDLGYVKDKEPFKKLVNQGMILGPDFQKMSKSRGNTVSPDEMINEFGADSVRLYEMFMGPLEKTKPWQVSGVEGIFRFLNKVWNLFVDDDDLLNNDIIDCEINADDAMIYHQTIGKVTDDIEQLKFNTAISQMMIFVNHFSKLQHKPKKALSDFIILISPFAPHLAEELWQRLGHKETIAYQSWPKFDESKIKVKKVNLPIQINGKLRDQIDIDIDSEEEAVVAQAKQAKNVIKYLEGKQLVKTIFIKNRIINFIIK